MTNIWETYQGISHKDPNQPVCLFSSGQKHKVYTQKKVESSNANSQMNKSDV